MVMCAAWSCLAQAEDGYLQIENLTIKCSQCARIGERSCKLLVGNDAVVMTCEEALEAILRERIKNQNVNDRYQISNPDLLAYLLAAERRSAISTQILQNLLATAEGESLFLNSFENIFNRYESAVAKVISEKPSKSICQNLWPKALQTIPEKLPNLMLLLVNSCSDMTEMELPRILVELPFELAVKVLEVVMPVLLKNEPNLSSVFKSLFGFLRECNSQDVEVLTKCREESERFSNKDLKRVALRRLQISTLEYVAKLSPQEALADLALLNVQDEHSRALLDEVYNRLLEIRRQPLSYKMLGLLLEDQNISLFLEQLSQVDSRIRLQTALAYVDLAKLARRQGENAEAFNSMRRSFRLFGGRNEERDRELLEMFANADSDATKKELAQMLGDSSLPFKNQLRFGILGVLVLVIVFGFWQLLKRSDRPDKIGATELDRQQMRDDLRFFGLSPFASIKELTAEYHRRVKEAHPDVTKNKAEEFHEIRLRYERALGYLKNLGGREQVNDKH